MRPLIAKHKTLWSDKFFITSAIIGVLFFSGSLFINYGAIRFSAVEAGNATTDILLDNLPVVNIDIIFSEGTLLFIIFIVFLLILNPKTIPFTLKSVALFVMIRSFFVIMTHLGPAPGHITTDFNQLKYVSSGYDLFFSGHTGLPFLMALLFWDNKYLRWLFLSSSIIAAAAVILGHLHYTIDVFSAFFISYGIYHISLKVFHKDHEFFINDSFDRLKIS